MRSGTFHVSAIEVMPCSDGTIHAGFETASNATVCSSRAPGTCSMTVTFPFWKFTLGNPAAVEMFRTKDEAELASLGPEQLSPERQPDGSASADEAKKMIETAMRRGSHSFEWTHQRRDGTTFPATVRLTRVELDGRAALAGDGARYYFWKRVEQEQALAIHRMEALLVPYRMGDQSLDDHRQGSGGRHSRDAERNRLSGRSSTTTNRS